MGDQEFFQLVAVIGLVDMFVDVFSVAAQEIGGGAFEASLADGGWRLDIWEVAAKEGLSTPKNSRSRCGGV